MMMTTGPHGVSLPGAGAPFSPEVLGNSLVSWEWWRCSSCKRPIARYRNLTGEVEIRCRSCKTTNLMIIKMGGSSPDR